VGNSQEGEGGQDCLSMANQEVHVPGSGIHIRPHGDGKEVAEKEGAIPFDSPGVRGEVVKLK